MATKKKMLLSSAGTAAAGGGAALDIDDVFSTYLYEGTGSAQTITNGIDLDGEGGLVWMKARTDGSSHSLQHKTTHYMASNETGGESATTNSISSFNSNGFTLGSYFQVNHSSHDYASWTFRKAPKFFDVVTYTGNSTAGRSVSHNLGVEPALIIVKCTSHNGQNWIVYHKDLTYTKFLKLNLNHAQQSGSNGWNSAPTSTEFYVGTRPENNESGWTYVAYLFAHNDGDGDFGPDGDADIIKCGSYTGGGSSDVSVNLGFEPQWLLIKTSSRANEWMLVDTMRGAAVEGNEALLTAESSNAEFTGSNNVNITPTGFDLVSSDSRFNDTGHTYIYIAIRRGPLAVPEDATEVFAISDGTTPSSAPNYTSGFPVDLGIEFNRSQGSKYLADRLRGAKYFLPDSSAGEGSVGSYTFDYMSGWLTGTYASTNIRSWMWKRAPGYFDAVAYSGNSTAGRTVSHNLGVAPEMMWVKKRSGSDWWGVYHKDLSSGNVLSLNQNYAAYSSTNQFTTTSPTDAVFSLGSDGQTNASGETYIAYLFASAPGVSKVGSYTGNGTSQTIDCGFTSGARFVLIKSATVNEDWFVFDTERGIVAGNDPFLKLNSTNAEESPVDFIDPHSSGFIVNGSDATRNQSGQTYIFYAIA